MANTDEVREVITDHFTRRGINPETRTAIPLSCGQAKALAFIVGVGGTEKLTGSEKLFTRSKEFCSKAKNLTSKFETLAKNCGPSNINLNCYDGVMLSMSIKNLVSQGVQDIFAALKGERVVENHFLALSHIQAEGLLFLMEHPIDPDIFQRDDGEAIRAAQSEMVSALRQSIICDDEPLMIEMTHGKKAVIGMAVSTLAKSLEALFSPQSLT